MNDISEETKLKLFSLQKRCIVCGGTYMLQPHHRVFRSEEPILNTFLLKQKAIYENCYDKELLLWKLHDIQNLCVLCSECHIGNNGVHNGNEVLRQKLKNSFTCPTTGFNIPFRKIKSLY